jgi:hypothetical protein
LNARLSSVCRVLSRAVAWSTRTLRVNCPSNVWQSTDNIRQHPTGCNGFQLPVSQAGVSSLRLRKADRRESVSPGWVPPNIAAISRAAHVL